MFDVTTSEVEAGEVRLANAVPFKVQLNETSGIPRTRYTKFIGSPSLTVMSFGVLTSIGASIQRRDENMNRVLLIEWNFHIMPGELCNVIQSFKDPFRMLMKIFL